MEFTLWEEIQYHLYRSFAHVAHNPEWWFTNYIPIVLGFLKIH